MITAGFATILFQFLYGAIEGLRLKKKHFLHTDFNSCMVRLKVMHWQPKGL
ncbi:hypothetical protein A33Q_1665 [Indibacter alkaliphilus LW1]|uniref:Uncharacterized protein n=1 Tax=Indibacter alkaliphilus (strain CCUG 57479 / KCTC 22604 / LW1) TaxID=1189612 RepID=S2E0A1_INDAL|nr:hypothetical protein A33Q_1665 [Indibacter alkaliphilus LW1]